ncbi:unnamed protein product [Ectocarpus sp. 6 AP-2014]
MVCGVMRDHGRAVEGCATRFHGRREKSTLVVAHNMDFDQKVVAAELYRMGCNDDARPS